jgi:hypothetical protein
MFRPSESAGTQIRMRTQHGGPGVEAPLALRAAAPDTVEHILAGVPALRRAGLDDLADSIEAMAVEIGLGVERPAASLETRSQPGRRMSGGYESSRLTALVERSRLELGSAILVLFAGLIHVRTVVGNVGRALDRSLVRQELGRATIVVPATLGGARKVRRRIRWAIRYSLFRRRGLVWGIVAVAPASLLVGWVVTRLH